MSRFAPVCPPQMAQRLLELGLLGDYHLLLAHDIAEQPEEYTKVFNQLEKATLILDNSVIECGIAAASDVVHKAYQAICGGRNEVVTVLPDVLGDGDLTAEHSITASHSWPQKGIPGPYMVVPQGETVQEFYRCARELSHIPDVTYWGIPRHMVSMIGSRQRCIDICREFKPTWKIHLLGFSDDIIDDVAVARRAEVEGIDSAVPMRMGMLGMVMSLDDMRDVKLPKRMPHWWDAASLWEFDHHSLVATNVSQVREWLNKPTAL